MNFGFSFTEFLAYGCDIFVSYSLFEMIFFNLRAKLVEVTIIKVARDVEEDILLSFYVSAIFLKKRGVNLVHASNCSGNKV